MKKGLITGGILIGGFILYMEYRAIKMIGKKNNTKDALILYINQYHNGDSFNEVLVDLINQKFTEQEASDVLVFYKKMDFGTPLEITEFSNSPLAKRIDLISKKYNVFT